MWNSIYNNKKLIVWIDITQYCNAKCPQCHRTNPIGLKENKNVVKNFRWTFQEFEKAYSPKVMEHIEKFEICGTWGDPITNPDIEKIVMYIIENSSCNIQINTNGSIRSDTWWFKMGWMTQKRLEVWFDVDGITQEMHEFYRRNTNLEKVLTNMEAFSVHGKATTFCVTFEHNEEYLEEIKTMVEQHGSNGILFFPSNRWKNRHYVDGHREFEYSYKGKNFTLREINNYENPLYKKEHTKLTLRSDNVTE